MRDLGTRGTTSVRVNPILCEGVGICAHLAADLVTLDPWGFPLLPGGALTPAQVSQMRRAVNACPRRALILDEPKA